MLGVVNQHWNAQSHSTPREIDEVFRGKRFVEADSARLGIQLHHPSLSG